MLYCLNSYINSIKKKHLHKISVSVFFLLLVFVFGCTKERTIQNTASEIAKIKSQLPDIQFSKRVYTVPQRITTNAHAFSSEIAFKEVYVYKNDKNNTYTFVWIVDAVHTNFDELSKWKIGMILKPKNKADFQDEILQKKGIKTMGVLTTPFLLADEICVVLRDFKFEPKEIAYSKFYLYNEEGKANLRYWIIENVSLK
ncbi:hypothetical protein [Kordia sp.]|uniref:hypothetical protein n=1 Tax=Kordia sp. TaxID=1965332 RepID=UPI003D2679E3